MRVYKKTGRNCRIKWIPRRIGMQILMRNVYQQLIQVDKYLYWWKTVVTVYVQLYVFLNCVSFVCTLAMTKITLSTLPAFSINVKFPRLFFPFIYRTTLDSITKGKEICTKCAQSDCCKNSYIWPYHRRESSFPLNNLLHQIGTYLEFSTLHQVL